VALTEEYSATTQNKPPTKIKDLDSFSIPCLIGNVCIDRALCDFRLIVSLMPLYMCNNLDLGELRRIIISLQLATVL